MGAEGGGVVFYSCCTIEEKNTENNECDIGKEKSEKKFISLYVYKKMPLLIFALRPFVS